MPYFAVNVRFRVSPDESRPDQKERRDRERSALKAAGYKEARFNWTSDKQKVAARKKAEEYAANASEATGVLLTVAEGDYL